jgi:hypothetical protein
LEKEAKMPNYDWIVEQLRLCQKPGAKLDRVAQLIVQEEGNESEKYGLAFELIPLWAKEKAEKLLKQATENHYDWQI